ncbi:MAG: hypothetical protein F9K18_14035, partial [Thermoanaerobaculia bacterium]
MLLVAATVLVATSFLDVEIYDLDIWWHLAIGREILAHLEVPRLDHWTVLGAGRAYHDSHWLFQAAAALAERVGGMAGVQALMVGLWALTLAAAYRIARRRLPVEGAALLTLAPLAAGLERILPRPELVTFAALAWFLVWLGGSDSWRPAGLARLALVQVAWTNAHGLFVLGPFAVGCHAAAEVWR